jgi:hypothetical protein
VRQPHTAPDKAPETTRSRALRIPRAGLPVELLAERPALVGVGIGEQLAEWVAA